MAARSVGRRAAGRRSIKPARIQAPARIVNGFARDEVMANHGLPGVDVMARVHEELGPAGPYEAGEALRPAGPGEDPVPDSGSPSVALREAMRTSQASAISSPPPSA